jgi:hypothetical protein
VDPFKGTKPGKGSNKMTTLMANPQLSVFAYRGKKLQVAKLYNLFGDYIQKKAKELKIKPIVLGGLLHVLSEGQLAFNPQGRMMVTFYIDRFWTNWGQWHEEKYARHFGFNHQYPWMENTCRKLSVGPWMKCHKDQDTEWDMLRFGQMQNDWAALKSAGMGLGRVKGDMFKVAGYKSPMEMFVALSKSPKAQIDAFVSVMKDKKHAWCLLGLRTEKYGMWAHCYNGDGGRHGMRYVRKLKRAMNLYGSLTDADDQ